MRARPVRGRIWPAACVLLALSGCGREPDPASRKADAGLPPADANLPAPDARQLARIAPFALDNADPLPWEDSTLFSNPLQDESLMDSLHRYWNSPQAPDTVHFAGEAWTSLVREDGTIPDFRYCEGNAEFLDRDGKSMERGLFLGYAPSPDYAYRIAGAGGELLPWPLRIDSIQARVLNQIEDDTVDAPLWRVSTPWSSADEALGALRGKSLLVGSREPPRNVPVRPAPLSDSLKLLCLDRIFPDPFLIAMLAHASFFSAGSEGGRARHIVSLYFANQANEMFAVETAEDGCRVLFRLAAFEHGTFLNRLSLTGSALADVFFVRIYETVYAILPRDGRWFGIGVGNCDRVNTGC